MHGLDIIEIGENGTWYYKDWSEHDAAVRVANIKIDEANIKIRNFNAFMDNYNKEKLDISCHIIIRKF